MRWASAFLDQRRDDQNMTMHDIKSNLYPCAHCEGSGTCRNGEQQLSCAVCIKESELKGKSFGFYPISRDRHSGRSNRVGSRSATTAT